MLIQHYLHELAKYHRWAYETLFATVKELPDKKYRQDCGLFFKSIHDTLNHLCAVDILWYCRFANKPNPITTLTQEMHKEKFGLFDLLLEQADLWISFTNELIGKELPSLLCYQSTEGKNKKLPYVELILHVFNHGTHHRGQISAALTQLKYPTPEMDIPYFLQYANRK